MPRVVELGLIVALAAGAGFGQHRGGGGFIPAHPVPLGGPLPPLSPIPPFGVSPRPQFAPQRGFGSSGFYSLPYFPAAYGYSDVQSPGVTIIQQFGPPPEPAAPAVEQPPVTSEVHEYPATAAATLEAEPATFTIVLKNGSSLSATAVTVQGNALKIVEPDGEHRRVPLDAIDREATRRLNAQRNLRLQLPAPPAQ